MSGITCLYVGKTKNLKQREYDHRRKNNSCHSKYIPDNTEWTIELIEECEDNISIQRERYYIEYLEPLYNKIIPGRTKKEYNETYKQKYKTYYEARREHIKTYQKAYRLKNKNSPNP